MKHRIRIGVTGLGRIGWDTHCRALAEHPAFELVAVADPEPDRRIEAEKTHGVRAYPTHEQMLEDAALAAVVVASPTHLHKSMALAAFRAGLHVLLEKPMAATLAEAQAIARAAKRADRVLTVYQPHRVAAYFQHILRIVRGGKLGDIYHVRASLFSFARRNDWQALRKYGGGMLNNYGAHRIDQLLHLTGSDVKRAWCHLRRVASLGDADDVVKVVYETRGGAIGEADINQASPHKPHDIEVIGTRGVLVKDGNELRVTSFSPRQLSRKQLDTRLASSGRRYPRDRVTFKTEVIPVNPRYAVDVFADFARAIRGNGIPFVRPEETLTVMRLLERCRRNAGRIVSTPL